MKILVKPEDLNKVQEGKYEALCELGNCTTLSCAASFNGPPITCAVGFKEAADEGNNVIVF